MSWGRVAAVGHGGERGDTGDQDGDGWRTARWTMVVDWEKGYGSGHGQFKRTPESESYGCPVTSVTLLS